ncbi:MAG TPA: YihY/virulence factor BrkB family protein [Thermoleophilaceae bacterium]|nr:YihY/virulence factor BrkB family protein [Thermoleophilaceae bacterium]
MGRDPCDGCGDDPEGARRHEIPPPLPATARRRARAWRGVKAFYWKAYEDNLTGLAGMVAYNLLLSVFPLALLALFVAGRVIESRELEEAVLSDLKELFPSTAESTLSSALDYIRTASTSLGVVALVTSIWIGSSFWGALDTAFCRIYHVRCRSWVEQKRFALAMLVVVLLLLAATVAVPVAQSVLVAGTDDLPFGLSDVGGVVYVLSLLIGIAILFGGLSIVYWTVPNRPVPWRAIWPGATGATIAIAAVDYSFPAYISQISTIARFGTTAVFVVLVLIWFYVIAIVILGGATINAMRFEMHDTGRGLSQVVPAIKR